MFNRKPLSWLLSSLFLILLGGLTLLPGATTRSALARPPLVPDGPADVQALAATGDPASIEMDKDGYITWTYDYSYDREALPNFCWPYSRVRWPFNLGTQDPTELSEATLIFTFAEMEFAYNPHGPDYFDPTWAVALNGNPGMWVDGSFTGDWNIIGAIGTEPAESRFVERIVVEQEVPFDATELIDGENNIWFQQQDFCDCDNPPDCACTCYELFSIKLRARAKLGVKEVWPAPDAQNVRTEQHTASEIRVQFTIPVSPTTVNEETFQLFYYDQDLNPIVVDGRVEQVSDTEFTFTPAQELKDGIRYEVQIWDEDEALRHGHDQWVTDLSGGPLENGRIWSFWTMPKIEVKLAPVQVLESFDYQLIQNKPTALKVYMRWDAKQDVFHYDQLANIKVDDIIIKWQQLDGSGLQTVHWNSAETYSWQPAWSTTAALRKREYREYTGGDDAYTWQEKFYKLADSVNYYGFLPRETGFYLITAQVKVLDNHGKAVFFSNPQIPDVIASGRAGIHMKAVAVGADYGKTGTVNLSQVINDHLGGVKAIFPVSTVPRPAAPGAMPWYTPKTTLWAYSWSIRPVWPYVHPYQYLLQEMDQLCKITDGCRAMVGMVDRAWLVDLGLTLREAAPSGALVDYTATGNSYRFITAHEVGHLTGIDEHLTQPGGEGLDVLGKRDRRNSVVPSFDYMDIDPTQYYMWIADARYHDLLTWTGALPSAQQLSARTIATTTDALLLAGGTITHSTGEVQLLPWYQLEPGTWDAPEPGPYRLVFLDAGGHEIAGYAQPFTATAMLRSSASSAPADLIPTAPLTNALDMGLFSLKVPFPPATAKVQILDTTGGATVLEEIIVSAAAPTLVIDAPGSATWSGPQPLTWQSDAAHFVVSVSTDNGATWQAQTIHLSAPAYTLETTALPDTEHAMIRIAATDGLRTTTVVTGPFTIDNPPQIAFVSPADGASGVNVETPVVAGFRDAIDPASLTDNTFTVSGGPFGTVTGIITYDTTVREATFIPAVPLAYDAVYTATLTTGVYDASGEAMPAPTTWTFTTTADFAGPRPNAFSPPNGALDVPRNTQIVVAWDKPLDSGTLGVDTFTVTTGLGAPVSGVVTYNAATHVTVFSPTARLDADARYIVTLKAGIQDAGGHPTEADIAWAFTTGETTPDLTFTGSYADWGDDTDGDGMYDRLVIRVGVQVTETGRYILRGTLTDTDGESIAPADLTVTLTAGAHFLDLAFDGASIGGRGVDGPYTLTELILHRMVTSQTTTLTSTAQQDAYRTFAYPAERFPSPLHFAGLPDVLLIPGTAALDAFNARDYAQHTTLASDQLSYTVMLNTNPQMDIALQSSGAVVLTPETYWQGNTLVTIRASDGVYTVQDTFEATVGWPHKVYLPVVLRSDGIAVPLNAWITYLHDGFESDTIGWSRYSWTYKEGDPPPGGFGSYQWDISECRAYAGQQSAWAYGGGDDGELLPCGAAYPDAYSMGTMLNRAMPINLKYVTKGEYSAKVWTNLATDDAVCLKVAVIESEYCFDSWPVGDYYGVCQTGVTNGWEDLTLDLTNVPTLGNVLGQERVCVQVAFEADIDDSRPEGAYVDDVSMRICPEGLADSCAGAAGVAPPTTTPLVAGNIGGYPEVVDEAALAVDAGGRAHALWTGKLNPNFQKYVFYSSSPDGVTWTPYQVLSYWGGREPQIAIDNIHGRVHLAYANDEGIVHHTVTNGVVSAPTVVAPEKTYYLPGFSLPSGGVAWPSLAVAEKTGVAYLTWDEVYYVKTAYATYTLRHRTWYAYWNDDPADVAAADSGGWSAPLRKINDEDTFYSTIIAAPDGQTMMAWFQRWEQSSGGGTGPGDPIVARTAYGTEPGSFPLRQATHALYPEPERDESIVLTYSGGDDSFVLASDHFMWPGHSLVYRYVWKDGAWSEPLDVAENTDGWGVPRYVGAAADTPLIRYVYTDNWGLKTRTEMNGALSPAQNIDDYLSARGYTGSPLTFFTDAAGGLHMIISGEKSGVMGFFYVQP